MKFEIYCLLGSFEEINSTSFFQGNDGLLPIGPLPIFSSYSLYFSQQVDGTDLGDLDLEQALDSVLNFNFICISVNLKDVLIVPLFLMSAFFGNQGLMIVFCASFMMREPLESFVELD